MCLSCKTTWSAAKKGHFECLKRCLSEKGWDPRTTQGAMENASREWLDVIIEMGAPRDKKECHLAARWGWRDIVVLYAHHLTLKEQLEVASTALLYKNFQVFELFENSHFCAHEKYTLAKVAIRSGNVPSVKHLERIWDLNLKYNIDEINLQCIRSQSIEMFEYIMEHLKCRHWNSFEQMITSGIYTKDIRLLHRILEYTRAQDGFQFVNPRIKNECFIMNSPDALELIHEYVQDWPQGFVEQGHRFRNNDLRREMIRFALASGCVDSLKVATAPEELHALMGMIEDLEVPEGKYLEMCAIMKNLHKALSS